MITYNFAGTAIRGAYDNRWTLVTITGADSAVPVLSPGNGIFQVSDTAIAINAGRNDLADQGVVAAWTNIDPGPDGDFSIISTHYTGVIPGAEPPTATSRMV